MKKSGLFLLNLFLWFASSNYVAAQTPHLSFPEEDNVDSKPRSKGVKSSTDSMNMKIESAYMWTISPRFGNTMPTLRDSARVNFHQSTLADGKDIAVGYLGNIGTPTLSKVFFHRPETSRFIFIDPFNYWRKNPFEHKYLNTKIPYSRVHYQTGGGGESKEEHFKAELSTNIGKKFNVGFDVDYLYARGYYHNSHNKQINYDFYASYIGDKYKMHAFFGHNNFRNAENGGIKNPLYITDPDNESLKDPSLNPDYEANFKDSKSMPVRIEDPLWNRLKGTHLLVVNRYDLGNDMEEYLDENDEKDIRKKENYIAPASVILTTHYQDQKRTFLSRDGESTQNIDDLYQSSMQELYGKGNDLVTKPQYIDPKYAGRIHDYMSYYSFKNTLALSMNEGFKPWMKFGLAVFVEYDMRKYLMPSRDMRNVDEKHSDNSVFIGGELSSKKSSILKYRAFAEKDLSNSDLTIEGDLGTSFSLKNRGIEVKANAYFKNISPSFFQNKFSSKYWNWDRDFNDTKRMYIGGEIISHGTNTRIKAGWENLKNYIYYGKSGLIAQKSGNVSVFSAEIEQGLQLGKFHWDNKLAYQNSSDESVIPVPALSAYTNVYLLTRIAKVLTLQIGVDAHFHTKYYAPGYEPVTMQFFNQRDRKIGNFPITTVYANLHLKNTRFFIMMYNAAKGLGNSDYFSLYRYPVNPRMLKLGLSWSFNN